MKRTFTRQRITRAVMTLLVTMLTATTAWADNVNLSVDDAIAEGTAGHWYVNMPTTGKNTLTLTEDAITAGKPYMVKWTPTTDNLTNPVFNNVTIDNTENNVSFTGGSFKGTYAPLEITDANRNEVLLLATGNKLGYAKTDRTVANGKALGTCRAYFEITGAAAVRSFIMDFGDDDNTTGIIEAGANSQLSTLNSQPGIRSTVAACRASLPRRVCISRMVKR